MAYKRMDLPIIRSKDLFDISRSLDSSATSSMVQNRSKKEEEGKRWMEGRREGGKDIGPADSLLQTQSPCLKSLPPEI